MTPEGASSWLYRMGPGLDLEAVDGPFTICNGIGWSPAGDRMYFVDSMRYVIHRYEFDPATGGVANRTDLVRFDPSDGIPDGLTVDEGGDIWCAMYGAGSVLRIGPDGTVREGITVPVSQPTSCAFGGPDLDVLYVTSAREGVPEGRLQQEPLAGGVFSVRPGVRGRPEPGFGAAPSE
jgi:sugar lactone lactonase YvrE